MTLFDSDVTQKLYNVTENVVCKNVIAISADIKYISVTHQILHVSYIIDTLFTWYKPLCNDFRNSHKTGWNVYSENNWQLQYKNWN